jgi:hypothetical protein
MTGDNDNKRRDGERQIEEAFSKLAIRFLAPAPFHVLEYGMKFQMLWQQNAPATPDHSAAFFEERVRNRLF